MKPIPWTSLGALVLVAALAGCDAERPATAEGDGDETSDAPAAGAACDADDGGLTLPEGFCAAVFHPGVGARARHLEVAPNGDLFVAMGNTREGQGGVVALRDTTGDGRADLEERFGPDGGNGILIHDGWLYFAPDDRVLRWPYEEGRLTPSGEPEVIVSGLPDTNNHTAKSLAIRDGDLFVNIGSPSNACQQESRTAGSPGHDPCPELDTRAGVWRFALDRTGQTQADGERFATGLRNTVALNVHPETGELYGVVHGRDQLRSLWPDLYTQEQSSELPAEEFVHLEEGDDFGWPYCYYDPMEERKVLAPEYGGDGDEVGRCSEMKDPLVGFPAHWAPNDLVFYDGDLFPERYRGGAFIAFHGSWNRAPLPQQGYRVAFVPMDGGAPAGDWETFADGFAGEEVSPRDADHRPVGLAVGPDGALYVTESQQGRVWRIVPEGG